MTLDILTIREQFPMFVNHPQMTYLDTAATALTPNCVIEAIKNYYTKHNTNINRGVDMLAYETTTIYENVREKVQKFINAAKSEEIIFTHGTTESINMIAAGFGKEVLTAGDEVILNIAEHHANLLPWLAIAEQTGAIVRYAELNNDGCINLAKLETLLTPQTKIVSFAHVTNVLGSYNNPQIITELVKRNSNAYVVIDGAQGIVQEKVDVQEIGCDFYVFSGHKLYGPTGIGILYGKTKVLNQMQPLMFGGDMVHSVTKKQAEYKDIPHKFEAGTMMLAESFGLGAAIDFVQSFTYEEKIAHIKKLRAYAIAELAKIPNVIIYNKDNENSSLITFNIEGVHAHDAASRFSSDQVVLRAGHHCAQLLLEKLQATASLRMSIGIYNDKADIEKFIDSAKKAGDFLDELFR